MSIPQQKKQRIFIDPDQSRSFSKDESLFCIGAGLGMILWGIAFVSSHGLQYPSLFAIGLCPVLMILCGTAAILGYTIWRNDNL
jgi:hypothetical protein